MSSLQAGPEARGMIPCVGIIGVGHLAGYLVEGLHRASQVTEIVLSPRNAERAARLADRFGCTVAKSNQAVADAADLILVTTRPDDIESVCQELFYQAEQTVVSVAVGLPLSEFQPAVAPAAAVRALPISCAAINGSPTLLYPAHPQVEALFGLLGQVHILADESQFTAASVLSAFYGWVYALLDEVDRWTASAGVEPQMARTLVLETVRGAAEMALAHPEQDLDSMLRALATPGGITEQGLNVLGQGQGLAVWVEALESVFRRLDRGNQE